MIDWLVDGLIDWLIDLIIGFIQAMSQDYDGRDDHDITIHPWIGTLAHMEGISKSHFSAWFLSNYLISHLSDIPQLILWRINGNCRGDWLINKIDK